MNNSIFAQIHDWPWSFGMREETQNLQQGGIELQYKGSPILSISQDFEVFLVGRYERFIPFGSNFISYSGNLQFFQVPHAIIADREDFKRTNNISQSATLSIQGATVSQQVHLSQKGALPEVIEENGKLNDSVLSRMVLAWSNFFDDCISEINHGGEVSWKELLSTIEQLSSNDDEPRMALIVRIAEQMRQHLDAIVYAARRLLVRERELMPAGQVGELDSACLQWYIRQPGETATQKAASNRQRLMGISRKETLDTLENKVLKDFLRRCVQECRRYLQFDCSQNQRHSNRGQQIRAFQVLCENLYVSQPMQGVRLPQGVVQPNYVLQNDNRYKKIWKFYVRLLRQEDEEDKLWAWQGRTWADIGSILLHATLINLVNTPSTRFSFTLLLESSLGILREQRLGCRLSVGSEPGPFLINKKNKPLEQGAILEIVHASHAAKHELTAKLGRIGAWLYFVIRPLVEKQNVRPYVIAIWPVHTAASNHRFFEDDIRSSAEKALEYHYRTLSEREATFPILHGLVLCNSFDCDDSSFSVGDTVHLALLHANPENWQKNIDQLSLLIEDILEHIV